MKTKVSSEELLGDSIVGYSLFWGTFLSGIMLGMCIFMASDGGPVFWLNFVVGGLLFIVNYFRWRKFRSISKKNRGG